MISHGPAANPGHRLKQVGRYPQDRPGERVSNSHSALLGLELAYYIGPIFFVLVGGLCFIGWNLTAERHGEIRRQLDARDAAVGT
jgi:Na+/melibiose symporter-like transporter